MELGFCRWKSGCGGLRAAVLVFLLSEFSIYSQNLVQNGNFGANGGSFTDWTISYTVEDTNFPNMSPMIFEGGSNDPAGDPFYARFLTEESGNSDILSQNIPTVPGDIYLVSFYAEDGAGHNFTTDFSFGNFTVDLGPAFEIGPGEWFRGWTNFSFTLSATQSQTDLSFLVNADTGSEFGVTGISVTEVPRPILEGATVAGEFLVMVTNASFPVIIQDSTNLVDWVSVSTNTAPCTVTNDFSMPQRFFRVAIVAQ